MFFTKLAKGVYGSKCPVIQSAAHFPTPHKNLEGKKVVVFKPIVPINTYKLHKALFDVTKDEIVTSVVLE
jgi:hypothetical protein